MNDDILADAVRLSALIPDMPICRNTVYRWAKLGKVPSARQIGGGEWIVSRKAIESWLTGSFRDKAPAATAPSAAAPVTAAIPNEMTALADLPETAALKALRRRLARPAALDRRVVREDEIGFADIFSTQSTVTAEKREHLWLVWMRALVGLKTLADHAEALGLVETFERAVGELGDDSFF